MRLIHPEGKEPVFKIFQKRNLKTLIIIIIIIIIISNIKLVLTDESQATD